MQQWSKLRQDRALVKTKSFVFIYKYLKTLNWEQLYNANGIDWFNWVLKSILWQRFKKKVLCYMDLDRYWKITALQRENHSGKRSSTANGYFAN